MILKQLKQLTLSATRRNARVLWLPRLYSSPAVCESVTTSKSGKKLSRNDRRAVVETFVTEYRAANAGKFPTLKATVKEVGGGYYIVRDILQELKLKPNAPVSRVPASAPYDASSLKQDHTIDSPHPISGEASLQGDNNHVITATHDKREIETAPLDKDVDSKCDSKTHLPEMQSSMVAEEGTTNPATEEEGTLAHLGSQEPEEDHLEGLSVLPIETRYQYNVIDATHAKRETETAPPNKDVDSKCDNDANLPENQTSKVAEECLRNSETKEEGTLTLLGSQEPKADHLEGANVFTATHVRGERETVPPNNDVDSECDSNAHLIEGQTSMIVDECLKNSETEEEGTLDHLGSQELEADHLEGANVLPTENHLPESQTSKVAEECKKDSDTEEEGKGLGSQEPKADHQQAAVSANVLPSETRQIPEKGDGEVKTGESSSAWSNIISFAKGFANFWRKG